MTGADTCKNIIKKHGRLQKKVIFFVNKIKRVKSINRGRVGRCRQWEDDKSAIKSNHCVALSRGATVIGVAVQKYCTVRVFVLHLRRENTSRNSHQFSRFFHVEALN